MSKTKQLLLSEVWPKNTQKNPSKPCKITLFGKAITQLDVLPCQPSHNEKLDLSHNIILNLSNITQFSQAHSINLSHNKISDATELLKMKSLPRLKTLTLKGNPFLKDRKLSLEVVRFLMAMDTDYQHPENKMIGELCQQKIKMDFMQHFCHKLEMHMQLTNQFNLEQFETITFSVSNRILKPQIFISFTDIRKSVVNEFPIQVFKEEQFGLYLRSTLCKINEKNYELSKAISEKQELLSKMRIMAKDKKERKEQKSVSRIQITEFQKENDHLETVRIGSKEEITPKSVLSARSNPFTSLKMPKKNIAMQLFQNQHVENLVTMLVKSNPVFQLLHSPLTSLKSNEKNLLIENLEKSLKQKIREIQKLQRLNAEHHQTESRNTQYRKDLLQLQQQNQLLKHEKEQINEQYQHSKESKQKLFHTNTKLSDQLETANLQLQKLSGRLQATQRENMALEAQVAQIRTQVSTDKDQEELEQKVRTIHEWTLTKKYLALLQLKANKFKALNHTHNRSEGTQKVILLQKYFNLMKQSLLINQKTDKLLLDRKVSAWPSVLQGLASNIENELRSKESALTAMLLTKRKTLFLSKLLNNQQTMRLKTEWQEKVENHVTNHTLSRVFNVLASLTIAKREQRALESATEFNRIRMYRNVWYQWIKYLKLHEYKSAETVVAIQDSRKTSFLSKIGVQYFKKSSFRIRQLALTIYLQRYRLTTSFHFMKNSLDLKLQKRSLNCQLIRKRYLYNYLQYFIKTASQLRVKKQYNHFKEEKQHRDNYEKKKRTIIEFYKKQYLNQGFYRVLRTLGSKVITKSLLQAQKMERVGKGAERGRCVRFFRMLRRPYVERIKIGSKARFVENRRVTKSMVINQKREFLRLLARSHKQTKVLTNYLQQKQKQQKSKIFMQWRHFSCQLHTQYLEERLGQMGPQIQYIISRQQQAHKQKKTILEEVETQKSLIKEYQLEITEYRQLLQNKEIKYEKLKDVYMNNSKQYVDVPSAVFRQDLPERDCMDTRKLQFETNYLDLEDMGSQGDFFEQTSSYPTFRHF